MIDYLKQNEINKCRILLRIIRDITRDPIGQINMFVDPKMDDGIFVFEDIQIKGMIKQKVGLINYLLSNVEEIVQNHSAFLQCPINDDAA